MIRRKPILNNPIVYFKENAAALSLLQKGLSMLSPGTTCLFVCSTDFEETVSVIRISKENKNACLAKLAFISNNSLGRRIISQPHLHDMDGFLSRFKKA